MRTEKDLRPYQRFGVEHILSHPESGLFLGLGLGKTITTLTAIHKLIYEEMLINRVLIVAPKKVAETVWHTEIANWSHVRHLTYSLVLGDERKRKAALEKKADIYIINRENLVWLQAFYGGAFPFDMVVLDELSSFKSHTSKRFKALKMVRPLIKWVVGLTATPMPNGLLDLWPQIYLLDMGKRLGKNITAYRDMYFVPNKRKDNVIYDYKLRKVTDADVFGADIYEKEIFNKIGDICVSMKARDYLDLPPRTDLLSEIVMPADIQAKYDQFEKDAVMQFLNELGDQQITALNSAALNNKLLQFANGAIYTTEANGNAQRDYVEIHTLKLDMLGELLEAANGDPVLIFYSFKSDVVRIKSYLKEFKPVELDPRNTLKDIESWNRREKRALIVHPASAGHGLNLQHGGHLMYWFQRPWSLELYEQGIGRVDRSGQTLPVFNYSAVVRGTMDEDVLASHEDKAHRQDALLHAVKARIEKYRGLI